MSSTYLVLKNTKENSISDGTINSSMEVNASNPVVEVQSFGMSEILYLSLFLLLGNMVFKLLEMVLNFLTQRWMQRKNGINSDMDRGVNACASLNQEQQKDIS